MTKDECGLIRFIIHTDSRGSLIAVESGKDIPFEIKRVFFINDVPLGATRADHASKSAQIIICTRGSCRVRTHDGKAEKGFFLCRPDEGLMIPPFTWRKIEELSSGCQLTVLSDAHYDPDDYIESSRFFAAYDNKNG